MTLQAFLDKLHSQPEAIRFTETMDTITKNFHYTPRAFRNGDLENAAGRNEGSCKIFGFAHAMQLSQQETLQCFGDYYREDVLKNPTGNDHGNIRNFQKYGWQGIHFDQSPLTPLAES